MRDAHVCHQPSPLDVAVIRFVINVWRLGTANVTLNECPQPASATSEVQEIRRAGR